MNIDLTPYEYERILVGYMLNFEEAPKYVLPWLTHDKFIHSTSGQIEGSKDFSRIWQAITEVYLVDRLPINVMTILKKLNEDKNTAWMAYLKALKESFRGYFGIREFNPAELEEYANKVIKSGTAYYCSIKSYKVAKWLENYEEFSKFVNSSVDIADWLRGYIGHFSDLAVDRTEGYTHISSAVEKTRALADRIYSGEQVSLLPCGLPSIRLPVGKLILLFGESNGGKSLITHQLCLGTAIGLKHYGVKGSVAVNSLEEREEPFTLKLAAMLAGVNMWEFQYGLGITDREKYRLDRALEYVAELPIYLDTTNALSTSVLDYRVTGLHASDRGPVHLMSVDYLGRLDLGAEDAGNQEQAIDKAVNHFADIVGTTGMTCILISQVTQGNSGDYKARIAGADGIRGSRATRFAADILWEFWNPVETKKSGTAISIPTGLNGDQPWLLNPKTRFGPKVDPIAFGWQPEFQRVFDLELNKQGNTDITLFSHPLPNFDMVEAGAF